MAKTARQADLGINPGIGTNTDSWMVAKLLDN
jgi:hypothetical protein